MVLLGTLLHLDYALLLARGISLRRFPLAIHICHYLFKHLLCMYL